MINIISYITPWLGLLVCLFVMFTPYIDTKCPIRITKIALWLLVWTILFFYDYPYDAIKAMSIMIIRLLLLMLNVVYIIESALYTTSKRREKRIKIIK